MGDKLLFNFGVKFVYVIAYGISCLYYKVKKVHIYVTQLFSHARVIGFITTCNQTCDRTKVTRMILPSTSMKTVLEYL